MHDPYAIAVLFVVEFVIMWYLDKFRGLAAPTANPGKATEKPAVKTVGGFSDVLESDYFAQSVLWAAERKKVHRNIQSRPVVSEGKELSQTKMKSV